MSITSFYLDVTPSSSLNDFRSSFKDGLGRSNLFHFILKRNPNIIFKGIENTNASEGGLNGLLNNLAGGIGNAIGGVLGDSSGIVNSVIQNAENIYENLNGRGASDLVYRANKISIPDKVLDTYSCYTYGPAINFARALDSGSFAVTFINSSTYWEYNYFSNWSELITNTANPNSNPSFNVSYYDDYISECNLILYDEELSPSYLFTFTDIYPISVGGLNMDWSEKDNLSEFTVVFNYRIMTSNKVALSAKLPSQILAKAASFSNLLPTNNFTSLL